MPEPTHDAEVEQVLSAIRRLIVEGPPGRRAAPAPLGPLVLTPALRAEAAGEGAAPAAPLPPLALSAALLPLPDPEPPTGVPGPSPNFRPDAEPLPLLVLRSASNVGPPGAETLPPFVLTVPSSEPALAAVPMPEPGTSDGRSEPAAEFAAWAGHDSGPARHDNQPPIGPDPQAGSDLSRADPPATSAASLAALDAELRDPLPAAGFHGPAPLAPEAPDAAPDAEASPDPLAWLAAADRDAPPEPYWPPSSWPEPASPESAFPESTSPAEEPPADFDWPELLRASPAPAGLPAQPEPKRREAPEDPGAALLALLAATADAAPQAPAPEPELGPADLRALVADLVREEVRRELSALRESIRQDVLEALAASPRL